MEVSQAVDPSAYAIVGGFAPERFRVDDSAHFFRVMSDTLYRDKKRAAVRETMCNAIDAHIAAGLETKPIEVDVTETVFRVRDFGRGIPDEKLVKIYATYGGTTKLADERQTGGFGLGTKAPFAVTDHFTVVSRCEGQRAIYALHMGGIGTDGAPVVQKMNQASCDDSGITVEVPIGPGEKDAYEKIVRQIAEEGGMLANLNGITIKTRDLSGLRQHSYAFVKNDGFGSSKVKLLYSNVLYPVTMTPDIKEVFASVLTYLPRGYELLLYGQPNTITVQPSREGLSNTGRTMETLKKLARRLEAEMKPVYDREVKRLIWQNVKAVDRAQVSTLFGVRWNLSVPSKSVGATGMAVLRARIDLNENLGQFRIKIARIAGQHFRCGRKSMMTLPPSSFSSAAVHDQIRYLMPRMSRIVEGRPLLRYPQTSYETRLYPAQVGITHDRYGYQRGTRYIHKSSTLVIAATRAEAMTKTGAFALVDPKLKPEEIERIKARAAKFKFEVVVVERAIRVPKPKKVAEKVSTEILYSPFAFPLGWKHTRGNSSLRISNPSLKEPKGYVWARSGAKGLLSSNYGYTFEQRADEIKELFPDVALVTKIEDLRRLRAAGVKDLRELIVDQFKTIKSKKMIGVYAGLLFKKDIYNYPQPFRAALNASRRDFQMAHLLFGISTKHETDQTLWKLLKLAQWANDGFPSEDFLEFKKVQEQWLAFYDGIQKASKVMSSKAHDFSYLSRIVDILDQPSVLSDDESKPHFDLVKLLVDHERKRHKQKAMVPSEGVST